MSGEQQIVGADQRAALFRFVRISASCSALSSEKSMTSTYGTDAASAAAS
jgi:hypothetical protein